MKEKSDNTFLNKLIHYGVKAEVAKEIIVSPRYSSRSCRKLFDAIITVQPLHLVLKDASDRINKDKALYYTEFLLRYNPENSPKSALRYLLNYEEKGLASTVQDALINYAHQKQPATSQAASFQSSKKALHEEMKKKTKREALFLKTLTHYGVSAEVGLEMLAAPAYSSQRTYKLFEAIGNVQQLHQVLKEAPEKIKQDKVSYYTELLINCSTEKQLTDARRYLDVHEDKGLAEAVRVTLIDFFDWHHEKQQRLQPEKTMPKSKLRQSLGEKGQAALFQKHKQELRAVVSKKPEGDDEATRETPAVGKNKK